MQELKFPNKFLWGAATSAHQVEGDNSNNDWWQAENQGLLSHPARDAADHYNRFAQDFDLARELGHNAHRLSIEWSRIEPKPGQFDEQATRHYRRGLFYLREHGIEPIVTLHHFTNPIWFAEICGWENKNSPEIFARYVAYCNEHFGDYIKWWVTINEPTVYVLQGYFMGVWPPFQKNVPKGIKVLWNMAKAHRAAYRVLKKLSDGHKENFVSIAHNMAAYVPARQNNPIEKILASIIGYFSNDYFLRLIKKHYDYIGLNYYMVKRVHFNGKINFFIPQSSAKTDMGWEIAPLGLLQVLRHLPKYKKPILITENGLADAKDDRRWPFILNHLLMVHTAITEGVDVRGYLHWSLMDNLELAEGFGPRFGLIKINYDNQAREIRESARKYASIIKKNAIPVETIQPLLENNKYYPEVLRRYLQNIIRIKPQS